MGNRTQLVDTPGSGSATTTNYGYDAANRLTGVAVNGGTATPVASDADGNTLTDSSGRTFTWDTENRMTSCTLPNGGGTTAFTYGADGLRRSMTATTSAGSVTTDYIYDGTMLVREMQVAGPNNFPNIAAGTLVDTATYLQGTSGPSYRRNDITGIPSWYVYNGLGSVVGEVDPAGNFAASGEYDVYGAPRASTQSGTFDTRQRYVGQLGHQTDPETGGLIYMQARYYDPGMGRFVSEYPGENGENWFAYCDSNPVNASDPDGENPLIIAAIIAGALIGGIFDCENNGWSIKNFALGVLEGGVTTAGECFGGIFGGAVAGSLMGALDAWTHGGNIGLGAGLGAIFGALGGAASVEMFAEAGGLAAGTVSELFSEHGLLYVALGIDDGAGQQCGAVGTSVASNW
jgi:RHS repeat-associated protein